MFWWVASLRTCWTGIHPIWEKDIVAAYACLHLGFAMWMLIPAFLASEMYSLPRLLVFVCVLYAPRAHFCSLLALMHRHSQACEVSYTIQRTLCPYTPGHGKCPSWIYYWSRWWVENENRPLNSAWRKLGVEPSSSMDSILALSYPVLPESNARWPGFSSQKVGHYVPHSLNALLLQLLTGCTTSSQPVYVCFLRVLGT